ncbi:hypothetical protein ACFHW2_39440 [Actinomadura sp. LOL_016]|uniref:hypothetical protein n=1 Tax=unclassified Actinomadura TaxID=2626254 RepID=UPI003A7FA0E0
MSQWSPRTQRNLWTTAAVASAAPLALSLANSLFGGTSALIGQGFISPMQCHGWMHRSDLWSVPGYGLLQGLPWVIVLPAFVVWLVLRRRAVGWTAVAFLAPLCLAEPALFGYDVARWGRACVELWYPFGAGQVVWQVYYLLPLVLILAATYRPGRITVRTAAAVLVTVPLLTVAGDRDGPTPLSSPEDCENAEQAIRSPGDVPVQAVARMSERERKLAYLCKMRAFSTLYPGSSLQGTPRDERSDAILLDEGRRACEGEQRPPTRGARQPSSHEYGYLCPEVARAEQAEARRMRAKAQEEYEREQAKVRAYCERKVPDAGVRPVREYTGTLAGDLMRAYHVGELDEGTRSPYDAGMPDELVVADGGAALVTTETEDDLCVTVRAHRREPPPELDGWDRVVEVGFDSPDGRTTIEQMDAPSGFPSLTVAGRGHYRLRLHVTGRDGRDSWPYPAQRRLLVVFPGDSEKTEVLK